MSSKKLKKESILKIKVKTFGIKRWVKRPVTLNLGVMKYNNISIDLKKFELVVDDEYKRGKYEYYFELREKNMLLDDPKIYQCRAEDESSFKSWINRIENVAGRMDSYYLGQSTTPVSSLTGIGMDKSPRKSTPKPVKRSNSWHGQEESYRQKLKSFDYDFRISVIKKVGQAQWKELSFKDRLIIMENAMESTTKDFKLTLNVRTDLSDGNIRHDSPNTAMRSSKHHNRDSRKKKKKVTPKGEKIEGHSSREENLSSRRKGKKAGEGGYRSQYNTPVSKKKIREHSFSPVINERSTHGDHNELNNARMSYNKMIKHVVKKSTKKKKRPGRVASSDSDTENTANAVINLNIRNINTADHSNEKKLRKKLFDSSSRNNNTMSKNTKKNTNNTLKNCRKQTSRKNNYSKSSSTKTTKSSRTGTKHHTDRIKTRPITSAAINRWSTRGNPEYIKRLRPGELKKFELQERLAYKRSGLEKKAQTSNKIPQMHSTLDFILRSYTSNSKESEIDTLLQLQYDNTKNYAKGIEHSSMRNNKRVEAVKQKTPKLSNASHAASSLLPKHYGDAVLASRHSYVSSTLKDGCIMYSHPAEYTAPVQYSASVKLSRSAVSHNVVEPMTPPRQRSHPLSMRMSRLSATDVIPNNSPNFLRNKEYDDVEVIDIDDIKLHTRDDSELELSKALKIEHLSPINRSSPLTRKANTVSLASESNYTKSPGTNEILILEQEIIDLDKKLEKFKSIHSK